MPDAAFTDIKAFGEAPASDGPYMLKSPTAWQHNVKIDLVPNKDYKGPRKPKNGGLTLSFYETSEAAYNDLLSGSLDILEQVPTSALHHVQVGPRRPLLQPAVGGLPVVHDPAEPPALLR